jgi:hypothetical protein
MNVKTQVKSGLRGIAINHNVTLSSGLRVRSGVRSGLRGIAINHNETRVSARR